jgi:acetyl esterase
MDTESWTLLGGDYYLTRPTMSWFWRQYLGPTEPCVAEFAEPLDAASLTGMPTTLMITGGLDPLLDENEAYVIRLADAGCSVKHHVVPGAIHGFLSMPTVSVRALELLRDYCHQFGAVIREEFLDPRKVT